MTSLLNKSITILHNFSWKQQWTGIGSYVQSEHDQCTVFNTTEESRRATTLNILMTYTQLFLSDSSSLSRVPSSSWNNHKLIRVSTAEPQCGSVHGDLNLPCSLTPPKQNVERSMIPLHEKAFCLCFAWIRMCWPVGVNLRRNDLVYPKCMLFPMNWHN